MMTFDDLLSLLCVGTAPDRELDIAIWLTCIPDTTRCKWSYVHQASGQLCEIDETRQLQPDGSRRLVIVLPYTTSIDAALTLIPEGHIWDCGHSRLVPHQATVRPATREHGGWNGASDTSRAIAICIAAIQARATISTARGEA